ncbi:MAG: histidine--tRNA ligase [Candidatus Cloacimonetes bacterium]|jgi:histidyl-tRNA synthetase|nr:histidine--tRNA ligase [Candidatus Cloacimonadota bacterium]MBT6993457.1 histidine--tRNA ligase [Candidatus Cloacimonadota bacterium]MBT7469549.1 histidine--tRNA ligase [Candidatus Cloacimonadota bacterium]
MKKYKVPRGTFDILPEESFKWQYITKTFRQTTQLFNYREIVTPIFENSEIFERSVGDTSDIVEKEMYKFQDKKGRELALRPEGTAPVVRSFVENGLHLKPNSAKLYYLGPMFRYDRPQKGRYRQFYQYGIENIGSENPFIDAEVIAFAFHFLKELGLQNFELQINSIGCENCTKEYDIALKKYFSKHLNELCSDCKTRLEKNPKRVLDCKVKNCKTIAKDAPSMLDYLDEDCKTHFSAIQKYLSEMQIPFVINPKIVRGLDYYAQTAFEIIDTNLGAQNTLIGGGRYSKLVQQLGGANISGIGFAGGFERLLLSLENENIIFGMEQKPEVYFVNLGENTKYESVKIISNLRKNGISCEFNPDKISMNAQMKEANKKGVKFCLILGENELKNNEIILKNMFTSEQQNVKRDKIIEAIITSKKS